MLTITKNTLITANILNALLKPRANAIGSFCAERERNGKRAVEKAVGKICSPTRMECGAKKRETSVLSFIALNKRISTLNRI